MVMEIPSYYRSLYIKKLHDMVDNVINIIMDS